MENENTYTEVESVSWGSRLMSSIKGVISGFILIAVSIGLLWWNEGRAVKTAKSLSEGAAVMVTAQADQLEPANENKLVHVAGKVVTPETLKDETFGLSLNALKLKREVLVYQWKEVKDKKEEKKVGGKVEKTTTYSYEKTWSKDLISSAEFKIPEGHENPATLTYPSREWRASKASIGKYKLSNSIISELDQFTGVTSSAKKLPESSKIINEGDVSLDGMKVNAVVFVGEDNSAPQIGDMKIKFTAVLPADYSVVAKQFKGGLTSFTTSNGANLELVAAGIVSGEEMFQRAQDSNSTTTWILRLVGFVLMTIGFSLIFKPLVIVADVVPFIGDLLESGVFLISSVLSFAISFVTIAIAWIFYRPVLGIGLLVAGVAALVFLIMRKRKKAAEKRMAQEEEKPVSVEEEENELIS